MSRKTISIDPITRLEGHGKIQIFLDERGIPEDAVLQVPELRGFEEFCRGRRGEDMPRITERICGVCPEAHHFASTKALDNGFSVSPPPTAAHLRKLLYNSYIFADHLLHLFYLGGPDFLADNGEKETRNIVGVLHSLGDEIGKQVLRARRSAHEAIEIIGGHQVHPVTGTPGGLSAGITEVEREKLAEIADGAVEFAREAMKLFHEKWFDEDRLGPLLDDESFSLPTYYMGLVDEEGRVTFYEGRVKVIGPGGDELINVDEEDAMGLLDEHVEPWTYVKFPYLQEVGWSDFETGPDSGVFRVGPLARLNVASGMKTELAQEEYERYIDYFDSTPVHQTYAYHWARLIEFIQAAERMNQLVRRDDLTGDEIRNGVGDPGDGVGVIEAARGTLIHSYKLDDQGVVSGANMIVPTTSNSAALSISIRDSALAAIKEEKPDERVLNKVEMGFRPYDPCLACSTHSVTGGVAPSVELYDYSGELMREITG